MGRQYALLGNNVSLLLEIGNTPGLSLPKFYCAVKTKLNKASFKLKLLVVTSKQQMNQGLGA